MEKQKILIVILLAIVIVLVSYFSVGLFAKYKNNIRFEGYSIAIKELIKSAENEKCEPFSVFLDDKIVNLINVDCLSQPDNEEIKEIEE
jgi:hypothetical protein